MEHRRRRHVHSQQKDCGRCYWPLSLPRQKATLRAPQEVLPSLMLAAELWHSPTPSLLQLCCFAGGSQQTLGVRHLVAGSLHSPRAKVHSINIVSKASTASFLKLKSPSSSGSRTLSSALYSYVLRKEQGEEFITTSKYEATIHTSTGAYILTTIMCTVFQGGKDYIPLPKVLLCFSLRFSSSKILM